MDPMHEFELVINKANEKDSNGTMTVKDIVLPGYYRIRNGPHAGRVIIKLLGVGNKVYFANGLTWTDESKISHFLCERTAPVFSGPSHPVDRSEASWYGDGGSELMYHSW